MRALSLMFILGVVGTLLACRSQERGPAPAKLLPNLPRLSVAPGSSPFFTKDEVLRIAAETIKTNALGSHDYSCTDIFFAATSIDASFSNKWILRFAQQPDIPDFEFFIIVEDRTGKSTFRAW